MVRWKRIIRLSFASFLKNGVISMPRKEFRAFFTAEGGKYVEFSLVQPKSEK